MADPTPGDVAVAQQPRTAPVVLPEICARCRNHVAITSASLCSHCDSDEQGRAIEAAEFRGAA